ncbi:MAG: hypothetical protein WCO00_07705 [Rhodospirillaceae bacterium]
MRDARGIPKNEIATGRDPDPPAPMASPGQRQPRKRWSEHEVSQLRACCEANLSDPEIARRLKRTERAVRTMILRLGGQPLREATRPWTDGECDLIRQMHAAGANWAAIAAALPGRTPLAIYRKLGHLVGAAPFAARRRVRPPAAAAPAAPKAGPPPAVPVAANQPGRPPWRPQVIPGAARTLASIDTMVRWLRSRDFMVLKGPFGWRVDQHELKTDLALVDFVNVRRMRLRLPVFVLATPKHEADAFDIAG